MEKNSIIDAQEEQQFWEDAKAAQNAAPLPTDPEWEAYSKMMEEEEKAEEKTDEWGDAEMEADEYIDDPELSEKPPRPKHCPIPKDDIVPEKKYDPFDDPANDWCGVPADTWGGGTE